jgi:single-stranded DNA-binding protein
MVLAEGRIQQRKFTRNDGENRQVLEVYAEKVYFCDTKKEGGYSDAPKRSEEEARAAEEMRDIGPDDIPF